MTTTEKYIVLLITSEQSVPGEQIGVKHGMTEQPFLLHHNTQFSSKNRSVTQKYDLVWKIII